MRISSVVATASVAICLTATGAFASTVYDFTETFQSGFNSVTNSLIPPVVTGSFTGTANGDLITNLSDISVSMNGVALNGSGNLYASSYQLIGSYYYWQTGGAVASFDGKQNDFIFIDSDFPNNTNYTNYFYDLSGISPGESQVDRFTNSSEAYGDTVASWSVAAVPLPAALPMFGAAVAGFAVWGRRRARKVAA